MNALPGVAPPLCQTVLMERLDETARRTFLAAHPGWALDGETLRRTFEFDDFAHAMAFVTRAAIAAERADHHPDIDIRWKAGNQPPASTVNFIQ